MTCAVATRDWRPDVRRIMDALHPSARRTVLKDGMTTPLSRTLWQEAALVQLRLPACVGVRLMEKASRAGVIGTQT